MRTGVAAAVGVLAAVLLAGGGYGAADAYDLAPGVLTLAPVPPEAEPFPTAPGALPVPEPVDVLAPADPDAPVPDPGVLTGVMDALVADPRMGASTTVLVTDVLTGQVLVDVDAGVGQVPASTAKVLTTVAALAALEVDRTLPTTVVQPEPGRLVLVGGGDMMLAAGAGDPTATVGRAGLADLADATVRALALTGTTSVSLEVDDTLFAGPTLHPLWKASDVAAGYVAPVAALAVDVAKTAEGPYPPRHADPALNAGERLAALLVERGLTVGTPTRGSAPPGAVELARVESAPLREITAYVLHESDNTVAEVLGRLVAVERGLPASFEGATAAVIGQLGELGLDTTGAVLSDCSGLSAASSVSARLLVDAVLRAADADDPSLLPAVLDLPVGGWLGTLADRFTELPARGTVRAKTGSLPGVTSLAGTVLTADGRLLAFAVLADQTPAGAGQVPARTAIDAAVQQVAGCGCAAP